MKPFRYFSSGGWNSRLMRFANVLAMLAAGFWPAQDTVRADGTVTSCTETSLRAAMAGGGAVSFACDGTITLTSTISNLVDTVLDGRGRQVVISGGSTVRVFYVSSNAALTLINLTISSGRSPDGPNGIWTGSADGGPGEPGGGFYSCGTLTLRDCVVTANRTGKGGNGLPVNFFGAVTYGGDGGAGGGIYSIGTLSLSNCIVSGNSTGSGGGSGGYTYYPPGGKGGFGGAIYSTGALRLDNCTVQGNRTGNGADNPLRGTGASGGNGGGVWSGGLSTVKGCTFSDNLTGSGGHGGVSDMLGGEGGAGGSGGAICGAGSLAFTNCSFVGNSTGLGGTGGNGGPGGRNGAPGSVGAGAGIYSQSNLVVVNCTITTNRVGGGVSCPSGSANLLNSLIALNDGASADVSGAFQSLGHNLIGATNGSIGFAAPGDLVGSTAFPLAPKLGPFGNNGGPTPTLALLPGSPAIDEGAAPGAPATDQRGIIRPQGTSPDIGAYEFQFSTPQITGFVYQSAANLWLRSCGLPNLTYTLQTSTNLLNWSDLTNSVADASGVCNFVDWNTGDYRMRFYRLAVP